MRARPLQIHTEPNTFLHPRNKCGYAIPRASLPEFSFLYPFKQIPEKIDPVDKMLSKANPLYPGIVLAVPAL